MEIWVILEGEKVGPLHDFEIRRRITAGELPSTTPAWHEGMAGWIPLIEIDLFKREFEIKPAPIEAIEKTSSVQPDSRITPPPLPQKPIYFRRFWARWFDLTVYSGIWWFALWLAGQNIEGALVNVWVMFLQYVPWFVFETVLLHYFSTTPGKWLLGIQVLNQDETRLDLTSSTRRSMRVLFTGIGFGWGPLTIFCQILSYYVAKKMGNTLWDQTGGHRVVHSPIQPAKLVGFIVIFFAALHLQMLILAPYIVKTASESNPEVKKYFERNPPWQLPKRK